MTASERLADLIVRASRRDLPREAIEKAKQCLLDFLTCAIVGSRDRIGEVITHCVRSSSGNRESTVIGAGVRTTVGEAALANGTMAHALDYDDVSFSMPGHPSAPVFPAALALGEKLSLPGRRILQAAVVGIETECKLGRATHPHLSRKGWHPSGVLGTFGAAACSAVLLGLDREKTAQALGISCSLACGIKANFGSMTKPLHTGVAARSGVMASVLAEAGWSAGAAAVEGQFGFLAIFAEGANLERAFAEFGDPFEVVSPGIRFKKYPSCAGTHAAVEALARLIREHDFGAGDIRGVVCRVTPFVRAVAVKDTPTTGLEGKFSIPFCLAVYLLKGALQLGHFSDELARSGAVREMAGKTEVVEDPELSPDGFSGCATVVEVMLADGRNFVRREDAEETNGGSSLTQEELAQKYRDCVVGLVPRKKAEKILEGIHHFDELPDVRGFMDELRCS